MWMTESDEESDDANRPWHLDDIVSREYEYPDEEDTGHSTQGGDPYEGGADVHGEEYYEGSAEGNGMGQYDDGTVDPRERY